MRTVVVVQSAGLAVHQVSAAQKPRCRATRRYFSRLPCQPPPRMQWPPINPKGGFIVMAQHVSYEITKKLVCHGRGQPPPPLFARQAASRLKLLLFAPPLVEPGRMFFTDFSHSSL